MGKEHLGHRIYQFLEWEEIPRLPNEAKLPTERCSLLSMLQHGFVLLCLTASLAFAIFLTHFSK